MSSIFSAEPVCNHTSCCHDTSKVHNHQKDDAMESVFRVAEKITLFALGLFALTTAPMLFVNSFALGALIGLFTDVKPINHSHKHSSDGCCSHGFIESRLGIKFPDSIALLAGAAMAAEHMDHHVSVCVPIAGLAFGIWAGNLAAPSLQAGFRKITSFLQP